MGYVVNIKVLFGIVAAIVIGLSWGISWGSDVSKVLEQQQQLQKDFVTAQEEARKDRADMRKENFDNIMALWNAKPDEITKFEKLNQTPADTVGADWFKFQLSGLYHYWIEADSTEESGKAVLRATVFLRKLGK